MHCTDVVCYDLFYEHMHGNWLPPLICNLPLSSTEYPSPSFTPLGTAQHPHSFLLLKTGTCGHVLRNVRQRQGVVRCWCQQTTLRYCNSRIAL